jgi:hypothetical protein
MQVSTAIRAPFIMDMFSNKQDTSSHWGVSSTPKIHTGKLLKK